MRLTAVLVSIAIVLAFDLIASYCLYYIQTFEHGLRHYLRGVSFKKGGNVVS